MIRAVLDTNVLISALFWGEAPRQIVDQAATGRFQAVTSTELLAELTAVLGDDFEVPADRLDEVVRDLLSYAIVTGPSGDVPVIPRDHEDAKVLACALDGQADYVVTGDKDLLVLERVAGVALVTVRRFLEILWAGTTRPGP